MSIGIAALIIALASLAWNIVSTAYSWKLSKPAVGIVPTSTSSSKGNWLDIDIQNRGGAPIAVTQVIIYTEYERWWQRNYSLRRGRWRVWLQRKASRRGVGPNKGPDLPHTVQPYHAQKWSFDETMLAKDWIKSSERPNNFLIEVTLATGKKAVRKYNTFPIKLILSREERARSADPNNPGHAV